MGLVQQYNKSLWGAGPWRQVEAGAAVLAHVTWVALLLLAPSLRSKTPEATMVKDTRHVPGACLP